MAKDHFLHFTTAGNYPSNDLHVSPHVNQCGQIKDGISFSFGAHNGCWVLAFDDLKAIYEAAAGVRGDINEVKR